MQQPYSPENVLLFRRFIQWTLISTTLILSAVVLVSAIFFQEQNQELQPVSVLTLGLVLAQVILLIIVYNLAKRNLRLALQITCTMLLVFPLISAITAPETWSTIMLRLITLIMLMLPFITSKTLIRLVIVTIIEAVIVVVLGLYVRWFPPLDPDLLKVALLSSTVPLMMLMLMLLWSFHKQLNHSLAKAQTSNAQLAQARDSLEETVAERTSELSKTLSDLELRSHEQARLLREIEAQRQVIREISVPILPIARHVTIMPIVGELDEDRLKLLMKRSLEAAEHSSVQHVLLDITGVPQIDQQAAKELLKIVQSGRLLGTQMTIIGIRPEVAQSLVSVGVNLSDLPTFSDLQTAMQALYLTASLRY